MLSWLISARGRTGSVEKKSERRRFTSVTSTIPSLSISALTHDTRVGVGVCVGVGVLVGVDVGVGVFVGDGLGVGVWVGVLVGVGAGVAGAQAERTKIKTRGSKHLDIFEFLFL